MVFYSTHGTISRVCHSLWDNVGSKVSSASVEKLIVMTSTLGTLVDLRRSLHTCEYSYICQARGTSVL